MKRMSELEIADTNTVREHFQYSTSKPWQAKRKAVIELENNRKGL
jgi:hypothetical protein